MSSPSTPTARPWRTRRLVGLTGLAWAPDGDRLAAVAQGRLIVLDVQERAVRTLMGGGVQQVAWSSRAPKFAVVRTTAGRSEVVVRRGREARVLFSTPGTLGAPVWSPDAVRLLVPWPDADQWLFLRPHGFGRPSIPVANVARQFLCPARASRPSRTRSSGAALRPAPAAEVPAAEASAEVAAAETTAPIPPPPPKSPPVWKESPIIVPTIRPGSRLAPKKPPMNGAYIGPAAQ